MKTPYTFHSQMESQTTKPVWSNSPSSVNRNTNQIEVGKNLMNYSVIFGGNSLSPLDPVDSNPNGVKA